MFNYAAEFHELESLNTACAFVSIRERKISPLKELNLFLEKAVVISVTIVVHFERT